MVEKNKVTGYQLSRDWHDFAFSNPEKIKPNHGALYFFIIDHCNRLGWKEKFGLPSSMAMEAIGVRSYNTYISALQDLIDFGFVTMLEKSRNQFSANIIALSNFDKALDKALDRADKMLYQNLTKQSESTGESNYQSTVESTDSIIKQVNQKPEINMDIPKYEDQDDLVKEAYSEAEFRVTKAVEKIAQFFGVQKFKQSPTFKEIEAFVQFLFDKGKFDDLSSQFTAYKAVKSRNPEFKHSIKKYIGKAKLEYEDGSWNECDWSEKLKSIESTQVNPLIDSKTFN